MSILAGIVKRAVALGRFLQNPLAMVATLCGPGREILSWKLNPYENFLTPDEKYGMVEQVMVDVTNQVGLDINLAISHEWLFATLHLYIISNLLLLLNVIPKLMNIIFFYDKIRSWKIK